MPALLHYGGQAPLFPATPAPAIPSSTAFHAISFPSTTQGTFVLDSPTPVVVVSTESSVPTDQASSFPLLPASGQAALSSQHPLNRPCNASTSPMLATQRFSVAIVSSLLSLFTVSQVYQHALFSKITPPSERSDESSWVATSRSWLDRHSCKWFGLCGLSHLNKAGWTSKHRTAWRGEDAPNTIKVDISHFWTSGEADPSHRSDDERQKREIPQYVMEYAPLIHLYSGEEYWPCDIADHLFHTTPHLNYTPLQASSDHPNLTTLAELNQWGPDVYLQSDDNVEEHPDWLGGESNIPRLPEGSGDDNAGGGGDDADELKPGRKDHGKGGFYNDETEPWYDVGIGSSVKIGGSRIGPEQAKGVASNLAMKGSQKVAEHTELRSVSKNRPAGGRSEAPAVLVVVPKDKGVVDAFWFFFYCFNLGNAVFGIRCGNHVGDWEHTVVRFHNGEPKAVFFSEHSFGEAYAYHALEKVGKRPVGYSATGSHAMYATPGEHPYVLPYGILKDVTDRGPLWDPLLNVHSYTYDYVNDDIRSSNFTPKSPTNWFDFIGHWGDKFYPLNDRRQYRIIGQYHYVNGPLGPRFKNLGRKRICQGNDECLIKHWVGDTNRRLRRWEDIGEGETMSEEDIRRFFPDGLPQP